MSDRDIRVVGGGRTTENERSAIVEAVSRVLGARDARRSAPASDWSRAGRLEATGVRIIRERAALAPAAQPPEL
jgi:hypothetical protein